MKPNISILKVHKKEEIILTIEYNYCPDFYSFIYEGNNFLTLRKYRDARLTNDNICWEYDENLNLDNIIIDNQKEENHPYAGFKISLIEKIDESHSKINIEYIGNKSALGIHRKEIFTRFRNRHVYIDENVAINKIV